MLDAFLLIVPGRPDCKFLSESSVCVTAEDTVYPVVDSCSGIEVVSETCHTLKYKGYLTCISEDLNMTRGGL